jgi:hypothetical protein
MLRWAGIALVVGLHFAALLTMHWTEDRWFTQAVYVLVWGFLNGVFLLVLRRPVLSAALSLGIVQILIVLSQFKFSILWMTLNFFDVLIVDPDTFAYLLTVFPSLRTTLLVAAVLSVVAIALLWRIDPFRVPRLTATYLGTACLMGIVGLTFANPEEEWEAFFGVNHISKFARSGVTSVSGLMKHGWLESDSVVADRLKTASEPCDQGTKRPHIVMVLDESSFDISAVPGVKVPPDYAQHLQSFDGKTRSLLVESSGGPTWYTEYNVLTGLSSRSYGPLQYFVTRVAAGRVQRGLPHALRHCGYRTFTLYPAHNAFLSARRFQSGTGVQKLIDASQMGMGDVEPDRFFYNRAADLIGRERGDKPLFVFVYTVANHFPWDSAYRPDLTPDWRPLGNAPEVEEYVRRQSMSAGDYHDFIARLKRDFPGEPFLIVRFGDHQPALSAKIVDPTANHETIARRIIMNDPRYFTTYYAIDTINFAPIDLSSASSPLEAAYLPLVIQEAAGVPLDPSFAEQKKIFERCRGLFYSCAGGAEARRFNRLLIDAGLIKGLVSR